ncbi:hypothetical protein WR25_05212 [Diploscapter pachys]|uniref:Uncharacterized protein n=1 Tax=Diploscapter pachys TaxID=2018661 RepID=A0A2A2KCY9_9BILA|nr:hypothetical protein WR25_05212 [Diploscapter pachys]
MLSRASTASARRTAARSMSRKTEGTGDMGAGFSEGRAGPRATSPLGQTESGRKHQAVAGRLRNHQSHRTVNPASVPMPRITSASVSPPNGALPV